MLGAEVEGQILGAQHDETHPFVGGRDFESRFESARRLDQRVDEHFTARGGVGDGPHVVRIAALGDHHAVGPGIGFGEGGEIGPSGLGFHPVDAHQALDGTVMGAGEDGQGAGAGCILRVRGDGVFQVDADDVGAAGERLGIYLDAGARHVEQGAADGNGHFSHPPIMGAGVPRFHRRFLIALGRGN